MKRKSLIITILPIILILLAFTACRRATHEANVPLAETETVSEATDNQPQEAYDESASSEEDNGQASGYYNGTVPAGDGSAVPGQAQQNNDTTTEGNGQQAEQGPGNNDPSAAGADSTGWRNLGMISIPPHWTSEEQPWGIAGPGPTVMDIFGEGVGGTIHMAAWQVAADDPNLILDEFTTRRPFTFDDGRTGYMLTGHAFDSGALVVWYQPSHFTAVGLYDNGNTNVFNNNEALILSVARTLTQG